MKRISIYLFDGFSDWEIAYVTPELIKSEQCELTYISSDGKPVQSMGGLNVTPDKSLHEVTIDDIDMLILPGRNMWEVPQNNEIEHQLREMLQKGKQVAAICGATVYLTRLGLLDNVHHTSNALPYVQWIVPEYKGASMYVDLPAITDHNITTASGLMPIEFAQEIFKSLNIMNETDLNKWYQLFKNNIWTE